jgi:hypothetical protein
VSLETDLYTLLVALCPRVFPDVAPGNTERPYITWQQVGGQLISPLANEVPDKRNANIQINVWATTRLEAVALAQQVEAAMIQATVFQARPNMAHIASYEEDLNLYGTVQDFSVWALR